MMPPKDQRPARPKGRDTATDNLATCGKTIVMGRGMQRDGIHPRKKHKQELLDPNMDEFQGQQSQLEKAWSFQTRSPEEKMPKGGIRADILDNGLSNSRHIRTCSD